MRTDSVVEKCWWKHWDRELKKKIILTQLCIPREGYKPKNLSKIYMYTQTLCIYTHTLYVVYI